MGPVITEEESVHHLLRVPSPPRHLCSYVRHHVQAVGDGEEERRHPPEIESRRYYLPPPPVPIRSRKNRPGKGGSQISKVTSIPRLGEGTLNS